MGGVFVGVLFGTNKRADTACLKFHFLYYCFILILISTYISLLIEINLIQMT
jgi:hypothetical protein